MPSMTQFPVDLPGAERDAKMWANPNEVEPAALDQLRNIAALPWVEKLRVMPDVHLGKGATVGSVIAMRNAVSPSAVGVDIGCGMIACQTSLAVEDLPDDLRSIRLAIESRVPVGFNLHDDDQPMSLDAARHMSRFNSLRAPNIADRANRAARQIGTLGGGNHFIELCSDDDGQVWIMLHSGSRNIGKELAERHIDKAKGLDHNLDLPDRDLAVFLAGTAEMDDYLYDLKWAQDYALRNREAMLHLVQDALRAHFPAVWFHGDIQCHHNYVSEETCDGVDVIVTRKGAISARDGQLGVIPGSMGTGSYIVEGLGNPDGLYSASHGAGRRMSRTKAKKAFTVDDLIAQTNGVECRKDIGVLDEIPGAYKDLETVIKAQSEGPSPLVRVIRRLTTLLCVKG